MKRIVRTIVAVAVVLVLVAGGIRLALAPTPLNGYRQLDDYNIAVRIAGSKAQWRDFVVVETDSTVTVGLKEIWFHGPGFDDEIAYVAIRLRNPLGIRTVIDASTGETISLLPAPE